MKTKAEIRTVLNHSSCIQVPAYLDDVKKEVEAERDLIQSILDEEDMKHDDGPRVCTHKSGMYTCIM